MGTTVTTSMTTETAADTAIKFLYLNEEDMITAGVTDMSQCVEVMEDMFKLLSDGDYMMGGSNQNSHGTMVTFPDEPQFPNMPANGPDRRFMAMPAYLGGSYDVAGVKWYGSNADNRDKGLPRSILMLMLSDKDTGAPLALMSANLISAYRTGAIPGVGAKYLAKKGSKSIAIIGPGVMSKTSLASFVCTCPDLDTIQICGRGQTSIDSFVDYVRENFPQFKTISAKGNMAEACKGADIISVGTSSAMGLGNYPELKPEWLKPGALVTAPACVDIDSGFLASKARLVLDNYGLYEAWTEEYPYPSFDAVGIVGVKFLDMVHDEKIQRSDILELGDIIRGKVPARQSDDDIIIFSIGGMPVEDLAWGMTLYQSAMAQDLGVSLDLWNKPYLA